MNYNLERLTHLQKAMIQAKEEQKRRNEEKKDKRRQAIAIIEANIMSLESYPKEQPLVRQITIYRKIVELLKEQ